MWFNGAYPFSAKSFSSSPFVCTVRYATHIPMYLEHKEQCKCAFKFAFLLCRTGVLQSSAKCQNLTFCLHKNLLLKDKMRTLGCCALFCRRTTYLRGSNKWIWIRHTLGCEYSETSLLAAFAFNCPSQGSFLPPVTKIMREDKPGKVIKNPLLRS